jgi:hypothetical protein
MFQSGNPHASASNASVGWKERAKSTQVETGGGWPKAGRHADSRWHSRPERVRALYLSEMSVLKVWVGPTPAFRSSHAILYIPLSYNPRMMKEVSGTFSIFVTYCLSLCDATHMLCA